MANYAARHSIPPNIRVGNRIEIGIGLGGVGNVDISQLARAVAFVPHLAGDVKEVVRTPLGVLEKLLSIVQTNLALVVEQIRVNPNDDDLLDQEQELVDSLRQLLKQMAARK